MEETQENDLQEVQPDENEQGTDEPVVTDGEEVVVDPKMKELQDELADKDEQIANLSRLKREQKKEAKKSVPNKKTKQSDELDYGQKAYLNTKEIAESEHDFVNTELQESGLSLNELLDNGYFQAKLKEMRDTVAVKEATPSSTRGSTESANTKVGYWIDKGELPPNTPDNQQLRTDVVNARMENNKSAKFSSESIIEG